MFAISFVVLGSVGHHIVQSEPVVAGNKVHTGRRATHLIQVWRALDAGAHLPYQPRVALYKSTDTIAKFAIPLRPAPVGRERPYLIESAGIPRFGDQFALAQ